MSLGGWQAGNQEASIGRQRAAAAARRSSPPQQPAAHSQREHGHVWAWPRLRQLSLGDKVIWVWLRWVWVPARCDDQPRSKTQQLVQPEPGAVDGIVGAGVQLRRGQEGAGGSRRGQEGAGGSRREQEGAGGSREQVTFDQRQ